MIESYWVLLRRFHHKCKRETGTVSRVGHWDSLYPVELARSTGLGPDIGNKDPTTDTITSDNGEAVKFADMTAEVQRFEPFLHSNIYLKKWPEPDVLKKFASVGGERKKLMSPQFALARCFRRPPSFLLHTRESSWRDSFYCLPACPFAHSRNRGEQSFIFPLNL